MEQLNNNVIGALEELLSQIKIENKKFEFSSAFEKLKRRVETLEEEVKQLKNEK